MPAFFLVKELFHDPGFIYLLGKQPHVSNWSHSMPTKANVVPDGVHPAVIVHIYVVIL